MTYPEAVASSDAVLLLSRTKLLVEVEDLIDAVLANLALKLFIFRANKTNLYKMRNMHSLKKI